MYELLDLIEYSIVLFTIILAFLIVKQNLFLTYLLVIFRGVLSIMILEKEIHPGFRNARSLMIFGAITGISIYFLLFIDKLILIVTDAQNIDIKIDLLTLLF